MEHNWNTIKKIHFVGIKGVAMTALALWAKEKGFVITGSDVAEEFPTDLVLRKAGIEVNIGFDATHVHGDLVIYTGAHDGKNNTEVVEAIKQNIPTLAHGKALGSIMNGYKQLSVAGCHGKTTTTAMIATIFSTAGLDPSYAVGSGEIRGLGLPGHAGKGQWFIAEADEYITDPGHDHTPRFLWQKPNMLVITSIDYDHPDAYPNLDAVGNAYIKLVDQMTGEHILIFNGSDSNNQSFLQSKTPYQTYGNAQTDLVVEKREQLPMQNSGVFRWKSKEYPIKLKVPGMHNLLNAAGAFLAAFNAGIEPSVIIQGLEQFGGAARRFEYLGEKDSVPVIDDYAHHPSEIEVTLKAAKEWYPTRKIIAVFQPHTYSRTKSLLHEFGAAFSFSDEIMLLPIYASAREHEKTIDIQDVVSEVASHGKKVRFIESLEKFFGEYFDGTKKNDIILCLGAGDIGRNARTLLGK